MARLCKRHTLRWLSIILRTGTPSVDASTRRCCVGFRLLPRLFITNFSAFLTQYCSRSAFRGDMGFPETFAGLSTPMMQRFTPQGLIPTFYSRWELTIRSLGYPDFGLRVRTHGYAWLIQCSRGKRSPDTLYPESLKYMRSTFWSLYPTASKLLCVFSGSRFSNPFSCSTCSRVD